MMQQWNTGYKNLKDNVLFVLYPPCLLVAEHSRSKAGKPIIPAFHYANIPIWAKTQGSTIERYPDAA